jgi:hypothetical protein
MAKGLFKLFTFFAVWALRATQLKKHITMTAHIYKENLPGLGKFPVVRFAVFIFWSSYLLFY